MLEEEGEGEEEEEDISMSQSSLHSSLPLVPTPWGALDLLSLVLMVSRLSLTGKG